MNQTEREAILRHIRDNLKVLDKEDRKMFLRVFAEDLQRLKE